MFKKAERTQSKLRLALCGPSGSGKTYSALQLAKGLGGKVAMIDTEHGSGSLYSDIADYDVVDLSAPFSPERYIQCIDGAQKAGYNVLIIDSLSHAWSGEGGVLEMVDRAAKASNSGNSYTAWRNVTPQHNRLVEAILGSDLHIITTMRTKTAYEMQHNDKGKVTPVKIGLAPIQRDGLEYEFTIVLDLSIEGHIATSSKDRTHLFDGKYVTITPKVGEELLAWLNSGKEIISRETRLEILLDMIQCAEDLKALEAAYIPAQREVRRWDDPHALVKILTAKDERKAELTKQAVAA